MSEEPDGREYRDLLLRLIDGIKDDLGSLRENLSAASTHRSEIEKLARDACNKLSELERRMKDVERDSRVATLDLVQIKAVAKGAGSVAGTIGGAVTGILCSILIAWVLRALHIQ